MDFWSVVWDLRRWDWGVSVRVIPVRRRHVFNGPCWCRIDEHGTIAVVQWRTKTWNFANHPGESRLTLMSMTRAFSNSFVNLGQLQLAVHDQKSRFNASYSAKRYREKGLTKQKDLRQECQLMTIHVDKYAFITKWSRWCIECCSIDVVVFFLFAS